jgi:hypothetical protein
VRLDYDARLRLRRLAGVLGPVLLLPAALWWYLATPPAAVAGTLAGAGQPDDVPEAPGGSAESSSPSSPGPAGTSVAVVQVTVLADGSFDVVEKIELAGPVEELGLVDRDLSPAGPTLAGAEPLRTDVQVVVRGEDPVTVPDVGPERTVPLPAATTAVEVRYHLEGATVRTVPGPPGRALGVVAPLTDVPGLVAGFELSGDPVRTLTCPALPASELFCGTDQGGTLAVAPQPAASALVLAQLDLDT